MSVLLFREQVIEHTQIHGLDRHRRHGRRRFVLDALLHRRHGERLPLGQQPPQRRFHRRLALLGRQVQEAKVVLVCRDGLL
jgi:hypothetical protein